VKLVTEPKNSTKNNRYKQTENKENLRIHTSKVCAGKGLASKY